MDVKQAVKFAKEYVADLLSDESVSNLGLEEIERENGVWQITLGFSRPWNTLRTNAFSVLSGDQPAPKRTYRVVSVRDVDGEVLAVKLRDNQD